MVYVLRKISGRAIQFLSRGSGKLETRHDCLQRIRVVIVHPLNIHRSYVWNENLPSWIWDFFGSSKTVGSKSVDIERVWEAQICRRSWCNKNRCLRREADTVSQRESSIHTTQKVEYHTFIYPIATMSDTQGNIFLTTENLVCQFPWIAVGVTSDGKKTFPGPFWFCYPISASLDSNSFASLFLLCSRFAFFRPSRCLSY